MSARILSRCIPSGVVLRALKLERWICAACSRDVLLRLRVTIPAKVPCHWCGADLYPITQHFQNVDRGMAAILDRFQGEAGDSPTVSAVFGDLRRSLGQTKPSERA